MQTTQGGNFGLYIHKAQPHESFAKAMQNVGQISQPTDPKTELSLAAVEALRTEVIYIVQQKFATVCVAQGSNPGQPAAVLGVQSKEVVELSESIIDLVTKSINSSKNDKPKAIARSDVSLASNSSHPGECRERLCIFLLESGDRYCLLPSTLRHNALEAKRASVLFWA